jgi:hypothetical protein
VHFVFRFLHASQAAEILALICRFRGVGVLAGWPSFAGLIGRAFGGAGMVDLVASSAGATLASWSDMSPSLRSVGRNHAIVRLIYFPLGLDGVPGVMEYGLIEGGHLMGDGKDGIARRNERWEKLDQNGGGEIQISTRSTNHLKTPVGPATEIYIPGV